MRRLALVGAILAAATLVMAESDPFGFMPDGGRVTFSVVFPDEASRTWALAQAFPPEAWETEIAARAPDLDERTRATLAAYLSRIAPYEGNPVALPPDGRDIALAKCLSCHSLFTGYLMQRRDRTAWLSTFASPFHKVIEITPGERELFADYSAINMPMRVDDVPRELRF